MNKTLDEEIDQAVAEMVAYDNLGCWFGLDHASWLTIPRVLMEAMPREWQEQMAKLLFEYDNEFPNQPDLGTRVQITQRGKLVKTPEWVINYRHPNHQAIDVLRRKPKT